MNYTEAERQTIASITMGQSENNVWHDLRKDRITASVCHRVYTRMHTLQDDPNADLKSLFSALTSTQAISHLPHVAWGIAQEAKAIKDYAAVETLLHQGLEIKPHGLQVSATNPLIACSPDGVVSCRCKTHPNKWLVEVKCPGTYRDRSPQEAAIAKCGVKLCNNEWILGSSHKYYYQVQLQLGIMGLNHCDLVVHTKQGNIKVSVPYNDAKFTEIMDTLDRFGKRHLFPHILSNML